MHRNSVAQRSHSLGRKPVALLVVPPFFELRYPCIGVHVLQACAAAAGFRVPVLYANVLFASYIGAARYQTIAQAPLGTFLGERLFARAAYGVAPLGHRGQMFAPERVRDDGRTRGAAAAIELTEHAAVAGARAQQTEQSGRHDRTEHHLRAPVTREHE